MSFKEYYEQLNPEIKEYFKTLSSVFPRFLIPYIETPTMSRLQGVSYFCGMEQGPVGVYNFKYYLSRLDHSISVALLTWSLTYNETATLQALFHDANTPALSHVIDYMNDDALTQESTEIGLKEQLDKDEQLVSLLKKNRHTTKQIADFKSNSIVDTKRPMLCADRLDSCYLTNLVWLQTISLKEIKEIHQDLSISINEHNQKEISFIDLITADRVVELQENINIATHKEEEFEAMFLLSQLVKRLIDLKLITYESLYQLQDNDIFKMIYSNLDKDELLNNIYQRFISLKQTNNKTNKDVKEMSLDPLVLGYRYSQY